MRRLSPHWWSVMSRRTEHYVSLIMACNKDIETVPFTPPCRTRRPRKELRAGSTRQRKPT